MTEQPPSLWLRVAMVEGKHVLECPSLAISWPGSDVSPVLSQFIGQIWSYGPTQTQRAGKCDPPCARHLVNSLSLASSNTKVM